jgi:uncharacterized protein (TIGR00369 family)
VTTHHEHCFGCGPDNPLGLKLAFASAGEHEVTAEISFDERHVGPPGIVHGGLIATVLDEALAQVPPRLGLLALTRELSVRYERKVRPGTALTVTARVLARAGRTLDLEAELREASGTRVAHARARFEAIAPGPGSSPGAGGTSG